MGIVYTFFCARHKIACYSALSIIYIFSALGILKSHVFLLSVSLSCLFFRPGYKSHVFPRLAQFACFPALESSRVISALCVHCKLFLPVFTAPECYLSLGLDVGHSMSFVNKYICKERLSHLEFSNCNSEF